MFLSNFLQLRDTEAWAFALPFRFHVSCSLREEKRDGEFRVQTISEETISLHKGPSAVCRQPRAGRSSCPGRSLQLENCLFRDSASRREIIPVYNYSVSLLEHSKPIEVGTGSRCPGAMRAVGWGASLAWNPFPSRCPGRSTRLPPARKMRLPPTVPASLPAAPADAARLQLVPPLRCCLLFALTLVVTCCSW